MLSYAIDAPISTIEAGPGGIREYLTVLFIFSVLELGLLSVVEVF